MSAKVVKKETMTGSEIVDDDDVDVSSPSSPSPPDYDDFRGVDSDRETSSSSFSQNDRRRFGNVYGPSRNRIVVSATATVVTKSSKSRRSDISDDVDGDANGNAVVPLKLEHKRARNREAASRCRKRKLDRIAALESRVAELNQTNESLLELTSVLTSQVSNLKQQIIQHVTSGCDLSLTPLLNQRQSSPPPASTQSPSSPVRHVVDGQLRSPTSSASLRHLLPPSPSTLSSIHSHLQTLPSSISTTLPPPPSLRVVASPIIGTSLFPIEPTKHSPPIPYSSRDSDSPEIEDVCLNLTVSSRRSPDDDDVETSECHEFKIECDDDMEDSVKLKHS